MPATAARPKALKPVATPSRRRVNYSADPRKILLAVDGSRASNAALRFARRMAQLNLWAPEAITITQPLPTYVGDYTLPAPPFANEVVQNSVLLSLRAQLRRHGLPAWSANVRFGPTGWSIIETARESSAKLIVIGLGKHGRIARLFGAETATRVVYKADIPVLAVHSRLRGLPRVIVAAVDFGESSTRSVMEAVELAEPGAQLHLVHVMSPYNFTPIANGAWRLSYAEAVEQSFARLRHALPSSVTVKTKLLTGGVADEVIAYAKKVRADLIAAGSHNQGMVERVLLGSAPAELLRGSPCSVLIAPPPRAEAQS